MDTRNLGFDTQLVHAGIPDDAMGSAVTPIYQTSTFIFRDADQGADRFAGKADGFIYSRIGNPTIKALEDAVAILENGFGGVATASGMGAVTTLYLALLGRRGPRRQHRRRLRPLPGAHGEAHEPLRGGIHLRGQLGPGPRWRPPCAPNTRLLYVESPSNPSMQVTDLAAAARIAHAHGALMAVDNTFASPFLQKPLDLGADVVLHSVTKFINGHADIVGGVLVAKTEELYKRIRPMMVMTGTNMDPHQAFMVSRGLKTLSLRMERAQANAQVIAPWLEKHPKIAWVSYIGLPSHPQYELVKRQMAGPGAMLAFELKGGFEAGKTLMNNVKLAALAVSLGGVETLICHPASMTHASMGREARASAGISEGLVRYRRGHRERGGPDRRPGAGPGEGLGFKAETAP